jgi:hypothetical protein
MRRFWMGRCRGGGEHLNFGDEAFDCREIGGFVGEDSGDYVIRNNILLWP